MSRFNDDGTLRRDWHNRDRFEANRHANERDESGFPRWMKPFAEYDFHGQPTFWHPDYDKKFR